MPADEKVVSAQQKNRKKNSGTSFSTDNFPVNNCHLLCNYDIPAILMRRRSFFFRNASDPHSPSASVMYACVTNHLNEARLLTASASFLWTGGLADRASQEGPVSVLSRCSNSQAKGNCGQEVPQRLPPPPSEAPVLTM